MADEFDALLQNLNINLNTAVRRAAVEIGEKIQDEYETAITNFYADYDPQLYDRTYSLYEGAKGIGGYGTNIKQLAKNMYECGITVGAENYSYNPYSKPYPHGWDADPSMVFPNVWDLGRHGFSSYNVRKAHAGKDKNDPKYWKIKKSSVPKNSTPPKRVMDQAFKKYDNQDYVFGVLKKYISEIGGF